MFTFSIKQLDLVYIVVPIQETFECSTLAMYFCISKTTVRPYLTLHNIVTMRINCLRFFFFADTYFSTYCIISNQYKLIWNKQKKERKEMEDPEFYKVNSIPK